MITINELASYMKLEDAAEWSPILEVACCYVSDKIEKYCGQNLASGLNTDVLNGSGTYLQMIKKFPVSKIDIIETQDDPLTDFEVLASVYYTLVEREGVYYAYSSKGFAAGDGNVKLTYTSGYSTLPDDVKKVAYEMAAIVVKNSDFDQSMKGGRLGVHSINEGIENASATTQYKDMWEDWKKDLKPYRVPLY